MLTEENFKKYLVEMEQLGIFEKQPESTEDDFVYRLSEDFKARTRTMLDVLEKEGAIPKNAPLTLAELILNKATIATLVTYRPFKPEELADYATIVTATFNVGGLSKDLDLQGPMFG